MWVHTRLLCPAGPAEDMPLNVMREVVVGVRQQNVAELDRQFWAVSTPGSPVYLQHLASPADLAAIVGCVLGG